MSHMRTRTLFLFFYTLLCLVRGKWYTHTRARTYTGYQTGTGRSRRDTRKQHTGEQEPHNGVQKNGKRCSLFRRTMEGRKQNRRCCMQGLLTNFSLTKKGRDRTTGLTKSRITTKKKKHGLNCNDNLEIRLEWMGTQGQRGKEREREMTRVTGWCRMLWERRGE